MKRRPRKTKRSSNKKLAGFGSSSRGSSGRPMTVKSLAKFMRTAMGYSEEESEARAEFYILFGYPAGKESVKDIKEEIERRKKWEEEKKANERTETPEPRPSYPEQSYRPTPSSHSSGGHTCSHHCYHTSPAQLGSRADTYAGSSCCHCGVSEPNPWENERR